MAVFLETMKRGWVGADCWMMRPEAVMGYLLGGTWTVTKIDGAYKPKKGEIVILRYERKVINTVSTHFVLAGPDGNIEHDPMGTSQTVQNGQYVSCRVFRKL